jgi:hypothetical protein
MKDNHNDRLAYTAKEAAKGFAWGAYFGAVVEAVSFQSLRTFNIKTLFQGANVKDVTFGGLVSGAVFGIGSGIVGFFRFNKAQNNPDNTVEVNGNSQDTALSAPYTDTSLPSPEVKPQQNAQMTHGSAPAVSFTAAKDARQAQRQAVAAQGAQR